MKKMLKRWLKKGLCRVSAFIMARRYDAACARAQADLSRCLPRVDNYLKMQKEEGGLFYDRSAFQLLDLWKFLERNRPRTIVEFGSGSTTSVFAEYALRNPGVNLVSLDDSPKYFESTRNRLDPALRDLPKFFLSERQIAGEPGKENCWYSQNYLSALPDKTIDLVYVDGPPNLSPTVSNWFMPCIDWEKLVEKGYQVRNLLFDNRLTSVRYLHDSVHGLRYDSHMISTLRMEYGDCWPVEPIEYHSRFWLRNPLAES